MSFHFRGAAARAVAFAFLTCVLSSSAFAATKVWTNNNGSGDGFWGTATNWSPVGVPTSADDVQLGVTDQTSTYLKVNAAATANSINVGSGFTGRTLEVMSGATLTIAASSTIAAGSTLYLNSGNIGGAGTLNVNGALDWTAGTIGGSGTVSVASSGTVTMTTTAFHLLESRTLSNSGTINWNSGDFYLSAGATLSNLAGGLIATTVNQSITHYSGSIPSFNNAGTFRKLSSTGTTTLAGNVTFSNSGTIDLQSGTLSFNNGGTNSGALNAVGTATYMFPTGTFTMNSGTTVTTAGTMRVNGGTVTIATGLTVEMPTLVFDSGTINGGGTLSTGANGTITWNYGTMDGGGTTRVEALGTLNMPGGSNKHLGYTGSRTLENFGTINLSGTGYLYLGSAATFVNKSTGLFHISTSNGTSQESGVFYYTGAAVAFTNEGTFRKSNGTSYTSLGGNVAFTNSGTIELQSGTIRFDNGGTNSGTLDGVAGTTYMFPTGTFTLNSGTSLSTAPTIHVNGATVTIPTGLTIAMPKLIFDNGTINGGGTLSTGANGTITWNYGFMDGGGTTKVEALGTLNMPGGSNKHLGYTGSRTLENFGTINLSGTGYLYLGSSATFVNKSSGLFHISTSNGTSQESGVFYYTGAAVTFTNEGTFRKSNGTSYTSLGGNVAFTNSGTIELQSGTIRFDNGGTNSGTLDGVAGTTYMFPSGTFTFNSGTSLSTTPTIHANGATVTIPTGLTIEMPKLIFDNGTINGGGTLSTGANGTITWNYGFMDGGGTTKVEALGTLNMPGGSNKHLGYTGSRTLENFGTINLSGTGYLYLGSSATFVNKSSGLFHIYTSNGTSQESGVFHYTGAAVTFTNEGTFRKSIGTSYTTLGGNVAFTNSGTIELQSGTIRFDNGGTNSGTLDGVAGATYMFPSGTFTFNSGTSLSTTPTIHANGATVTIPTGLTIEMPKLIFDNGTINGGGTLSTGANGTITWNYGFMDGGGTTKVETLGTLIMAGTNNKHLGYTGSRTLDNYGTINVTGYGSLYMSAGATFENRAGALFHVSATNGTSYESGVYHYTGTAVTFTNAGTFRKSAGAGYTTVGGNVAFTNSGAIEGQSGNLQFDGGGTHAGTATSATAGTITFGYGAHSFPAGSSVTGSGVIQFVSGTSTIGGTFNVTGTTRAASGTATFSSAPTLNLLEITSGTVNFDNTASVTRFLMSGGALGGSGTVTVSGTATSHTFSGGTMNGTGTIIFDTGTALSMPSTTYTYITSGRTLINKGTVTYGTAANPNYYPYLHVYNDGSKIVNNGAFNLVSNESIANGGTFENNLGATFTKNGGTGTSDVALTFNNTGTVNVSAGTLALSGAGGNHGGPFNVAAGAGLQFAGYGTHTVQATSSITSSGTLLNTAGTTVINGPYNTSGTTTTRAVGGTITFNTAVANDLIEITSGTANFNATTSTSRFQMSGGALGGSGTVTVSGTATSHTFSGGTMNGTGTIIFDTGTALSMPSTTYTYITSGRTLINKGTVTYGTAANPNYYPYLHVYNDGSKIVNNGAFNLVSNESIVSGGTFENNLGATFTKNGGTGTSDVALTFNNAGTVTVSSGTLALSGAGGNHGGPFNVAAGAGLQFAGYGTHTVQAASSITSSGTLLNTAGTTVINGPYNTSGTTTTRAVGGTITFNTAVANDLIEITSGTANFNATTSTSRFQMSGGALGGSGTVTVSGTATSHMFSGGTMNGTGTIIFDTGTALSMPSTTYTYITSGRTLTNKGTVTYGTATNPNYYPYLHIYNDGSKINNEGTFTLVSNESIVSGGAFTNSGTLKKNGGTGTSSVDVAVANSGTVQSLTGTLAFNGYGFTQTAGALTLGGGNVSSNVTLAIQGGIVGGAGTITANVNNSGAAVIPGGVSAAGALNITGTYTQSGPATLNIELGGTTVGTQYDRLAVSGAVTLAGDLNVSTINSFVPASGNTFQVLTFASRFNSTDFANKNGLNLGFGTNLIPAYSATDLQLTTNTVQTDMSIVMTATPATVNTGEPFTYNITVTNHGGSAASGVGVSAPLPANVTFVSASPAICTGAPNLVCSIDTLPDQGSASVVITVNTTAAGNASMTASVAASQFDPNGANNTATAGATVGAHADVSVSITNTTAPVAGATASYSIVVTNTGPETANTVSLAVSPSASLTFNSASGVCGTGFPCALGNLATGQSVTITTSWNVAPNATGNAQLAVSISAASPADLDPSDNTATATNAIAQQADVAVVKTGPNNVPAEAGTTVTYTITVTNNGPSEASAVSLDDPTPNGLTVISITGNCTAFPCAIGTMTVGQTSTTQVTYQVAGAVGTTFTNTATITSAADGNAANDQSSVSTTVSNCPATAITAPGSVNGGSAGNVASATVVSGATYTWSIANGTITNGQGTSSIGFTAGASGTVTLSVTISSGACSTNPSASVPIISADILVSKTGPANVSPMTASTITYSIAVMNNGPSAASSVVVSDPTPANLTFVSATGACSAFPCSLGTLPAGQTASTQATYSFSGGPAYSVTNTASVTSSTSDGNGGNNTASVSTSIAACPAVSISAPTSVEAGASATATVTIVTGAIYNWSINNGTITSGQGTTTLTFTAGPNGTLSLSVTVTAGSCVGTANANLPITATGLSVTKTGPASVSPATATTIPYAITVTNGGAASATNVTLSDPTPNGLTFVSATGACTAFPCSLGTLASGQTANVQATYSFTGGAAYSVTNVATVTASNDPDPHSASVTTSIDACPTIIINAPTAVEPGASATATATAVTGATYNWSITNGTITGGHGTSTITFTAGSSGTLSLGLTFTAGSCAGTANASVAITSTNLSVTKTGPASVSPTTASTITYAISVTNSGPASAANVTLSDPTPAELTFVSATGSCTAFPCSLGTLATGQTANVQATYSFAGGSAYSVTNVATAAASNDPNPRSASIATFIAACPAISITGPSALEPGATSTATANAVTGATYTWSITNGTVTAGQGTNNITFTAGGIGTTTLGVSVTAGQCTGSASHQIAVASTQADVTIAKSAPGNVASGASFTYTLTVGNNGPANADSVTVSDTLPGSVTFVSVSSPLCTGGATINCNFGTLASGASQVITIDVRAPQGPVTLSNTATVTTTSADPTTFNNSATAGTVVAAPPVQCPTAGPDLLLPENGASGLTSPITFDWDAVPNATSYELWVGAAGDDLALVATTADDELSLSLASGTFNWQVRATAAQSCTPQPSSVRSFTIPKIDACAGNGVATGLSPDAGTVPSPVTLSWNSVPNAIGYVVHYKVGGGPLQEVGSTTGAISLTASLPAGVITFVVDTLFNGCPPTRSAAASFTVQQPAACEGSASLTRPTKGFTTSNASVEFGWTAVSNAAGYRVWLKSGTAAPEVLASTLDITLTKVIPVGTHTWWVETLFPGCPSRDSESFTFTILPAQNCDGRGRPDLLAPTPGLTTSSPTVNFSWSAVTGAIEYELYLAPVGGVPTLVATIPSSPLPSVTAEVAPGQLIWSVRAIFNGCQATESDQRELTYTPPPNCTANERAVLHAPGEGERLASPMSFDWNDVAGATAYELYISHGNAEPELVATTTASEASGVQRQLGAGRWFVRTRFAQGCATLDSTESRFVVIPQVAACSPLAEPVISAPGQISSGVEAQLNWSFVPGATSYVLDISTDSAFGSGTTTTDMGNDRQASFQFTNDGNAPVAHYVRVHARDNRCNPTAVGPFSPTAIVYILPETTTSGSSLIGEADLVEYTLTLGPELAGETFTATPTTSWITVSPASGTVPTGGRTLTVLVNTAGLSPGTNIGGVAITTGASSRTKTAGSTSIMPVSISLVSPVTPTPKNTPPPDALVIPAVANAAGIGSHFQSDVRVSNTSAQVMKYQLSYIPTGSAGITEGRQTTFSIEPGRTVALDDILKTWFGTGTSNSVGSLEVRPLTEVAKSTSSAAVGALANIVTFASSRTFNVTPNGTFGQYIPAVPFANFIDKTKVLSLQQIAHSAQYRTNLGLVEGSGESANVLVKVFGSTGTKLTEFEVALNGGQHTQLNGFLSQHGITTLADGRVEVQVLGGNGKITAYASVLDNKTADPLLVSPVTLSDTNNTKWVVPGVADLNNGAANWQTDMRVFNAGSTPEEVTLSFYSQNGGEPKTTTMTLQPGEVRQLDKILPATFGVTQNGGAVHVTSADSARLIATARTYNETTQGTYGQFISAVTPAEAVGVGSRPLQLLQVEESSRYRSNIGLAEVSGKPVTLEVSIVPPDAKFTASVRVDLAANEFRQLTSMLAGLGLGDTYNARVTVRAIGGEGRATAYASVIDGKTNDPTYVPAQ